MLESKRVDTDKLQITIFDFPEINDILPMHEHTEQDVHITVVCRGSIEIKGLINRTAKAGDIIDWKPYQPHEFVALEKDTRVINIVKV